MRRPRSFSSQQGFTLIELLISISIVAILSAVSVQSFFVYKDNAYEVAADSLIINARTAMAAGKVEAQDSAQNWGFVLANGSGSVVDVNRNLFFPGLQIGNKMTFFAMYDGWCEHAMICPPNTQCCFVEWIEAGHCKASTVKAVGVWNTGEVFSMEWAQPGC